MTLSLGKPGSDEIMMAFLLQIQSSLLFGYRLNIKDCYCLRGCFANRGGSDEFEPLRIEQVILVKDSIIQI